MQWRMLCALWHLAFEVVYFKQRTAYEMRISNWSSDVCSSDLTASGDFVFGMQEAYLIEGGEITEPIREGNLIGNGPQCLQDIEFIADDFAFGGPGTCGKDGQGVAVGAGRWVERRGGKECVSTCRSWGCPAN